MNDISLNLKSNNNFERKLLISLLITLTLFFMQIIGGIIAHSLALLSDAAHMLSDLLALFLSWFSQIYSRKPADIKRSYGYHRIKIIIAFVNSITLFIVSGFIVLEALKRLNNSSAVEPINCEIMFSMSIIAAISSIIIFKILHSNNDKSLNARAVMAHITSDIMGFVATAIGALVIKFTGWIFVDFILSIAIACLILSTSIKLTKESFHILLEGTPANVNYLEIEKQLMKIQGVEGIHHLHAWSLSEDYTLITLHLVISDKTQSHVMINLVKNYLRHNLGFSHVTIELELNDDDCSDKCLDLQ